MSRLIPLPGRGLNIRYIAGTGGIGSGMFFRLIGNRTVGRNESRAAELLPNRDYCKQHIILHYLARLLGAGEPDGVSIHPIGKVGADETGQRLLQEMAAAGMDVRHVAAVPGASTLFSVCFQYPDTTGGNLTTASSASARVGPEDIDAFFDSRAYPPGCGVAMVAPEVPLEARLRLLERGARHGTWNAAAILSSEAADFERMGGFALTDYLAVNIDEAAAIAGADADPGEPSDARSIAAECVRKAFSLNSRIRVTVTDGPRGSYSGEEGRLSFTPALPVEAASAAGAGDAFMAGTIAGLICGLPFQKPRADARFGETPLASAVELGTLLAAFSVTSPDTIHMGADAASLKRFALDRKLPFSEQFEHLFSGASAS